MKKKIGIMMGILVVLCGLFYGYMYQSLSLSFKNNDDIEYGSPLHAQDFIDKSQGEVILPNIDTKRIGKQTVEYKVKNSIMTRSFSYTFTVKDTQKPIIQLKKESIKITQGDSLNPLDYVELIKDPVDGNLKYEKEGKKENSYTYISNVDIHKPGDYIVNYIAYDNHHNESEKQLKVKVEKKEEPKRVENTHVSTVSPSKNPTISINKNKIICIDAGHQSVGMSAKEANGPGSSTMKAKVTTGATGITSKIPESKINLEIALKLKSELEKRGYQVVMTRTSQDVKISNQQRAQIGNQVKAGAVIHLHCDSSNSISATGAHTICIAKNNPYCGGLYNASSTLARRVIDAYSHATGIRSKGVSYRNDLTGLNWSEVPSIYIELGFLSNESEEKKLIDSSFQYKCAQGIANGIDAYFNE